MKLCRATALCAWILAMAAGAPALACATKEDLLAQLALDLPGAAPAVVSGAAAERIALGIAALVGDSVPAGGNFALVDLPRARLTYVVRFAGGCATHHGRFPTALVQSWLGNAAREDR